MTESLLETSLCKLSKYQRLWVGYSGGLDSTVLLHCVASNPMFLHKVRAIHVDHGLSPNAPNWRAHCVQMCEALKIPLMIRQVVCHSAVNIEEGARNARYDAFSSLLEAGDALLIAHHQDDQAETLLLQLLRGAGIEGMGGMSPTKTLGHGDLCRPFLSYSRRQLEAYATENNLTWIEDESNQNAQFSRNYLRHRIIPLLEQKWPGARRNLSRTARHCQQAQSNLDALARLDCLELEARRNTLSLTSLKHVSRARVVNVLRAWLKNNAIRAPSTHIMDRIVDELVLACKESPSSVAWGGVCVRRYQQSLYILDANKPGPVLSKDDLAWSSFPEALCLPHLKHTLVAVSAKTGLRVPDAARIRVGFRQGGEVIRLRGQTKSLKTLWQAWHVPPWQRDKIPLIYIDDCLAAVVGYAVSDVYYARDASRVYQIIKREE